MTADETGTPINPKAEKAADKARAKAMRPWYKKKRFVIPAAILIVGVASSVASGNKTTPSNAASTTSNSASESPASSTSNTSGIGTQVSDGKFTFVVSAVKCGIPSVGDSTLGATAQGQFCIVDVTVANTGNASQSVDSSSMYLYDSQKRKFSTSSTAMFYLPNNDLWLTDVNPGNSIKGQLVFDLPAGDTPTSIELHDSMFSGGVTVQLTA